MEGSFARGVHEESDPGVSISVCVIKTLVTEELIAGPWGGVHAYLSAVSTVNAAVSTQKLKTAPQAGRQAARFFSQACPQPVQVQHVVQTPRLPTSAQPISSSD